MKKSTKEITYILVRLDLQYDRSWHHIPVASFRHLEDADEMEGRYRQQMKDAGVAEGVDWEILTVPHYE